MINYFSTKDDIHAFTKTLTRNLVGKGIRVNWVSPCHIWTAQPNIADKSVEEPKMHGTDTAMKRPPQFEKIASAFVYFASNIDFGCICRRDFDLN